MKLLRLVIGCVFIITVFLGINAWFTVRNIKVVGSGIGVAIDEKQFPKHLIFIRTDAIERQLRSVYPHLAQVSVQKQFPDTLVLHLSAREKIARVITPAGNFGIDSQGYIIDGGEDDTLPRLLFPIEHVLIGEISSDPGVSASVAFLRQLSRAISIKSIERFDTQSLVAKSATTDIIFPQNGDVATVVTTLQTLINGFRMKGTLPTVIDLRFDKPVVRF